MLDDTMHAVLRQRLIARATTINPDGYPHTVPIWYVLDGDDIVVATGPDSRKIKNIRINPKGAIVIGGEPVGDHERYAAGYLFQGEWLIEGEPGFDWIRRIARRYWDDEERIEREIAAWGPHQALRLVVHRVIRVME